MVYENRQEEVSLMGKKKSKTIHCSICKQAISGPNFETRMAKLRRHRKRKHPKAHKKSVKKSVKSKKPILHRTSPVTILPDGSGFFTATIETKRGKKK